MSVTCPLHPDALLIDDYKAGDQICSDCGLVVGDRVVDVGTEWRTFSNDKPNTDPCRVGAAENPLLTENLSTVIGQVMSGSLPAAPLKFTTRKQNKSDRVMLAAISEITNMSDKINLGRSIIDRANLLFKQAYEDRKIKGRNNDAVASACLYIACRQEGVPRTFKEICAVSRVSKKEIGRCFKQILRALETSVEIIKTTDFMARFCSNLDLPNKVLVAATCIGKRAVEMDVVSGRSPISVAAASIYLASQASEWKRTRKEIGEAAGVAEVTIRQSYKLLYPHAKDLFPENFEYYTPIDLLPQFKSHHLNTTCLHAPCDYCQQLDSSTLIAFA